SALARGGPGTAGQAAPGPAAGGGARGGGQGGRGGADARRRERPATSHRERHRSPRRPRGGCPASTHRYEGGRGAPAAGEGGPQALDGGRPGRGAPDPAGPGPPGPRPGATPANP